MVDKNLFDEECIDYQSHVSEKNPSNLNFQKHLNGSDSSIGGQAVLRPCAKVALMTTRKR